jgi:hypothetical protein
MTTKSIEHCNENMISRNEFLYKIFVADVTIYEPNNKHEKTVSIPIKGGKEIIVPESWFNAVALYLLDTDNLPDTISEYQRESLHW